MCRARALSRPRARHQKKNRKEGGKVNLLEINPRDYDDKTLCAEGILPWFEAERAYFEHGEPDPKKGHVLLTSGLHCGSYFDVPRVLRYANVAEVLGRQLGRRLKQAEIGKVDWVVSSAYSAIVFGHEVAKELGVIFLSTEKDPADRKKQLWQKQTIPAGATVLQVEELITTTQTLEAVRKAVTNGNEGKVKFLSTVGVLVLRPPKLLPKYDGRNIVALIKKEIPGYAPEDCPYCAAGSQLYHPKTHWKELTGQG